MRLAINTLDLAPYGLLTGMRVASGTTIRAHHHSTVKDCWFEPGSRLEWDEPVAIIANIFEGDTILLPPPLPTVALNLYRDAS